MDHDVPSRLERSLLLHLLEHRGAQVRFEADQWTTEFGISRAFSMEEPSQVKTTLRSLEMGRYIYRRVQYVIGYSEPKLVFSLTPSGHRMAVDIFNAGGGTPPKPEGEPELEPEEPGGPGSDGDDGGDAGRPMAHRGDPAAERA